MTPEGSQADSSTVVPIRRTPIQGAPAYNMAVHDDRITLWKRQEKNEGDGWEQVATIPCAITRYKGNDGLVHVLPDSTGDTHHATSDDIADGKTWRRIGVVVPRAHREAAEFALRQVAEAAGPAVTISPTIVQGIPPLAPPLGPAYGVDAELGRQTWSWLANRLAPSGRLTVGAALAAPFLQEAGGNQTLWTMWGAGGFGKTLLLDSCASIYGEKSKWRRTFNTTSVGLTSAAQRLSYYPLMLDETQGITSSPSAALTPIITGAERTRATRSGALAESNGSWHSLAFLTSNPPLRDELTHEMWDRRLIEVDAKLLWQPRPTDHAEESAWWADIASAHRKMQGWAWRAMRKQHCSTPESVEKWLHHVNTTISQPGQGNVGRITQLAIGGCQWLAEWTGNPAWTEGVTVAATSICDDVEDLKTDDARDAAEALMEHRAMYQDLWDGTGPRGETFAFPFPKDRGYDGPCKLAHEHSCEWVAILPSAWKKIAPELPFSRVKNTAFNLALAPGNDGKRLARKCRIPSKFAGGTEGTLIRAYVVCWHGVEYLAQPTPDAPPAPPTSDDTPPPSPQGPPTLPNTDTPPQPSVRADKTTSTRTATNAALKPSQPEPKFGSCSDPAVDIDETLSFAAAKGFTDISVPASWTPAKIEQAGWNIERWRGQTGIVTKNDAEIMVRPVRKPEKFASALSKFYEKTRPENGQPGLQIGYAPAGFAIRTIRKIDAAAQKRAKETNSKRKEPRWLLPDDVELPAPGDVAHPAIWGTKTENSFYFDRIKSHLPAITQANLAPLWPGEKFEHYTGTSVPEVSASLSGMWRITVPEWDPRLPSPVAKREAGSDIWVSSEIIRLYQAEGVMPDISEAWLAPSHRIPALEDFASQLRSWLDAMKDTDAELIPKLMYQTLAGRLYSEVGYGRYNDIDRPDWGYAIRDNSWCSTVRHTYRIAREHGIYPTAVFTDALYYETNVLKLLPHEDRPGHFILKPES